MFSLKLSFFIYPNEKKYALGGFSKFDTVPACVKIEVKMGLLRLNMPVVWLSFLGSWIINEFEKLGNQGSALGKQNLRVTWPWGKVEFKYFLSPVFPSRFLSKESLLAV